jgi:hypothetical protein
MEEAETSMYGCSTSTAGGGSGGPVRQRGEWKHSTAFLDLLPVNADNHSFKLELNQPIY